MLSCLWREGIGRTATTIVLSARRRILEDVMEGGSGDCICRDGRGWGVEMGGWGKSVAGDWWWGVDGGWWGLWDGENFSHDL